jgi:hypothetical protein
LRPFSNLRRASPELSPLVRSAPNLVSTSSSKVTGEGGSSKEAAFIGRAHSQSWVRRYPAGRSIFRAVGPLWPRQVAQDPAAIGKQRDWHRVSYPKVNCGAHSPKHPRSFFVSFVAINTTARLVQCWVASRARLPEPSIWSGGSEPSLAIGLFRASRGDHLRVTETFGLPRMVLDDVGLAAYPRLGGPPAWRNV